MPEGLGLPIGGNNNKYFMLQIHYENDQQDTSNKLLFY